MAELNDDNSNEPTIDDAAPAVADGLFSVDDFTTDGVDTDASETVVTDTAPVEDPGVDDAAPVADEPVADEVTAETTPDEVAAATDESLAPEAAESLADEAAETVAPETVDAEAAVAADAADAATVAIAVEGETAEGEATAAPETPSASETPSDAETPAAPEPAAEPEPVTAVTLGLLPEVFVSEVSTALHFYAPDIAPLPAPPADEDDDEESTASRRRRRRGGSGAGTGGAAADEPSEPRRRQRTVEYITEPQRIKGSTRLEAKKQRRRDGREAGRRRTVVTEAEFLARREAVDREMIVRSKNGRVQIAVLEDNILVEHYVARNQDASLIGNVYIGRVQNVLPSMEAAFVDIGRGRNAVLYSGEVDWDAVETGNQPRRIELALKTGDRVLVQVTKDPVGHKGARLTSQISLPGRYLVYVPGGAMNGISRKLPDTERARLKRILKEVLPSSSGVIVRTAAEGATEEQLTLDVQRLTAQWEHISKQSETQQGPLLLHSEPDLLVKIVRDVFNEDFTRMIIQGEDAHRTIESYLRGVAPDLLERISTYEGDGDPFDDHRISEQIEKALDRKVWLPSGGSLVIDRTEAMTVVDVNTGKFVGSGGNLEETVTKNNLEAAEEIVRQLRLRDIGGIIVVDFIDMVLESNRDLVLRRLVECLSRDRTKHQVAEVTSLGLVQMTRKKLGLGLLETFSEACEVCAGRGVIVHHDPVVKHRAPNGGGTSGSNRRSRGGSGGNGGGNTSGNGHNGNGQNGNGQPHGQHQQQSGAAGGTHVITEGVKSGLAKIAASTIVHPAPDAAIERPAAQENEPERPKKSRNKKKRTSSAPKSQTDQLLESVLEALPEPKAPGQGRSRRRVTTAALQGTPVSTSSTQAPSDDA